MYYLINICIYKHLLGAVEQLSKEQRAKMAKKYEPNYKNIAKCMGIQHKY